MFYRIDANVSSTLTFTSHWWSMVDIFYKRSFPAYIIMTVLSYKIGFSERLIWPSFRLRKLTLVVFLKQVIGLATSKPITGNVKGRRGGGGGFYLYFRWVNWG